MTDLFCGAGGSSSGATKVPGLVVRMAANHWTLAIETHNTNHPDTDHDCADISQVDPRRYPRTDILWASPECTNHSQAKGKKRDTDSVSLDGLDEAPLPDAAAERSRATMWDVPRFAERHQYRAIVIENVVDAFRWIMFPAWLQAMELLGYEHDVVWLNSMHAQALGAPAPQSRDRMYVVFWQRGNRRPDLQKWTRPLALCEQHGEIRAVQSFKKAERWGRYRAQYVYRCPQCAVVVEPGWLPAAAAIDWSLRGERIGDRAKPLAEKTRARIAAGLRKYGRPAHLEAAGNAYDAADPKHRQHGDADGYYRVWPADEPLRTLHTSASKALMVPVEGRVGKTAAIALEPMRTQSTRNETGVAVPPFLTQFRERARSTDPRVEVLPTVVSDGANHALVVNHVSGADATRSSKVDEVMPTFVAGGLHHSLVVPLRNHNTAKSTVEPIDTVSAAGNHHALLMRNNSGGAEMSTPVAEAMRTLTTGGHQSLLDGIDAEVDDCEFRMLEPHEIQLGMAFAASYVLLGTKREKVRQAGNAVTPPAARDLLAAVAESLGHDVELVAA